MSKSANSENLTAIDTLISADWLLSMAPAKTTHLNYSVAIRQGVIVDILPTQQAVQRYKPNQQSVLPNHVLMPGMVNAHGHAAMSLLRGLADDHSLMHWLKQHIWPAENRFVDQQFVYDGAQLAIAEMLRSGSTCFSDMYIYPEMTAKAADQAGVRCQLAFPVMDPANNWSTDAQDAISKGLALFDEFKNHQRISIAFGPHAPYTVSSNTFRHIVTLAEEIQAPIQIHLHETQGEVDSYLKQHGLRPIAHMLELGILNPNAQLVHMTALNETDLQMVKDTGSHIVSCPLSNLKLASGFCPVNDIVSSAINLALGTDSAASNNDLDMFIEMRTMSLLAKGLSQNAEVLPAWQVLEIATLGGAKALGLSDKIGSLEIGKQADIIAIDMGNLEQQPLYDVASQLVNSQCGHHVQHAWVNGHQVLKDRQTTQLPMAEVIANTKQWQQRISQQRY